MIDKDGAPLRSGETPDLPPCLIHVDKEGRLWHQGREMIHEGINRLLMAHVELDDRGRYIIDFNDQQCYVEVEDTFFVITRVDPIGQGDHRLKGLLVGLNDGSEETLVPDTLEQSEANILYAKVKEGRFPARFLRPAYYQLAEYLEEKNGKIILALDGEEYVLALKNRLLWLDRRGGKIK